MTKEQRTLLEACSMGSEMDENWGAGVLQECWDAGWIVFGHFIPGRRVFFNSTPAGRAALLGAE